ncbi:Ras family [Musa troglodytarum]|uniref:Ras family n=1 Tax=Musa troglodytarum TaxID=320322 RepID=A0A9E7G7A6_9LILI|nr:Ras family [Musa troglodytarum]URE07184.1 Ras family [Musa troglodytarum]
MCFGPPDLAFVFDLPGYGQVGKMAVMLRNVYDVICEKQAAMVRTSHLTKSLIIGAVVCSLRNEIMNYVFWCLAGFKGYPLLAKLNVPPTAGSRD